MASAGTRWSRVLAAVGLLGGLLTLPALAARVQVERLDRRVELVVDYESVVALARARGDDPASVLRRFAAAGATGAGVRQANLRRLARLGELAVLDAAAAARRTGRRTRSGATYVGGRDPALGAWLWTAWPRAGARGPASPRWLVGPPAVPGGSWWLELPLPPEAAGRVPLGLPPRVLADLRAAGLAPVPLLEDPPPGPTPGSAPADPLAWLRRAGLRPHLVLLTGTAAPGHPDRVQQVGEALAAMGTAVGLVEDWDQLGYLTQRGARELVEAARGRAVRAYAIPAAQAARMPPAEFLDRAVTSVLERRLRAVYLYPPAGAGPARLEAWVDVTGRLADRLRELGFDVGPARPFPPGRPAGATGDPADPVPASAARTARIGGALAAGAGTALAIGAAGERVGLPVATLAPLAGGAVTLLGWSLPDVLARQLAAAAAAVAFPLLGAEVAARLGERWRGASPALRGLGSALAAVAVATGGGLVVAGLLATGDFLWVWASFRGVKLSLALPILAAGILWLLERRRAGTGGREWPAGLLALAVAVATVVRSGAGAAVPRLEVELRRLLLRLFVVRPRFKEFLVGVPALVLRGGLAPGRESLAFGLLSVAGVVGLVSVVNSFAHVYTPVAVSLWRVVHGLALGLPLGLLALALALRAAPAARPRRGREP